MYRRSCLKRASTLTIFILIFRAGALNSAQTPFSVIEPTEAPILVKLVPPHYPPLALAARVWGDVVLILNVRKDGNVESVNVVSGPPFLRQAALDSAQQSQFECQACTGASASYRLVYSFQLGPTRYCSTSTVIPSTEPEQVSPRVTQSQNHITIFDSPVGTCDLPAELGVKTRSVRCLYLWRCAAH
jgi:TonB family protein